MLGMMRKQLKIAAILRVIKLTSQKCREVALKINDPPHS